MKTYSLSASSIQKKWWAIDAEGLILGRLASQIALRLRGKHKPDFTPHLDCGDCVIVTNADKIVFSGKKFKDKKFYWHTGWPGGIKERSMKDLMTGSHPERVVRKAVERMISRSPLGRQQMKGLKIFKGTSHTHEAQKPEIWDLKSQNTKNVLRRSM